MCKATSGSDSETDKSELEYRNLNKEIVILKTEKDT